ncbi:MAG: iron donor protein CyaY [Pseudomonadota bacterium]
MDEREYHERADAALAAIEAKLEAAEVDFEFAPGGVLEIEPVGGGTIVVNKQSATREIWVAAKSGGFHYRWDGNVWVDTRSGEPLDAAMARLAGC